MNHSTTGGALLGPREAQKATVAGAVVPVDAFAVAAVTLGTDKRKQ